MGQPRGLIRDMLLDFYRKKGKRRPEIIMSGRIYNALCDNDDEDDEYDDRDVDGDDGDQYRLAKEQEDQLNSEIRTLDMAGTFLPLTIKSLEVNMEQERGDHVTTVKVDTLKLIVQSPKHPLRCHLADFFRNLVIIDGECEHPTNDFTSRRSKKSSGFAFGMGSRKSSGAVERPTKGGGGGGSKGGSGGRKSGGDSAKGGGGGSGKSGGGPSSINAPGGDGSYISRAVESNQNIILMARDTYMKIMKIVDRIKLQNLVRNQYLRMSAV
ncbi:hypothetical protein Tco_0385151 [Tanacetum coccineum]